MEYEEEISKGMQKESGEREIDKEEKKRKKRRK